jgi:peptidoglycan hydrolase FlgJ
MAGAVGAPLAAGSALRPAAAGPAVPGSSLTAGQLENTRKSAQDFEAMAIGQLLQPMFKTVDTSKGLVGGGKGEAAWKPMMVDEMAKMLAKSGGIGIAASVMKEMLHIQESKNAGE